MSDKRTIGMWLYKNGGGDTIAKKLIKKLRERDILTIDNINLRHATAKNKNIVHEGIKLNKLDLFFSYNAGEQTIYQTYLYQALNRMIPMINSYDAFQLTEDKFQTSFVLRNAGVKTADYRLFHRDEANTNLHKTLKKWNGMVHKPTNGWGGAGLTKIEDEESLQSLMPSLNQSNTREVFVERFIKYDNSDFRVDIVDGKYVGCYGRRAAGTDWRTNVTSGGSVFMRECNEDVLKVAINAAKACGADIAGVDIIYDQEKEEYVVLEVNGIPAFATPEQEKMGLDFNDKKIDLIVDLIDQTTHKNKTK
jgi:ribosomal protein S6--L-glutamate ligase